MQRIGKREKYKVADKRLAVVDATSLFLIFYYENLLIQGKIGDNRKKLGTKGRYLMVKKIVMVICIVLMLGGIGYVIHSYPRWMYESLMDEVGQVDSEKEKIELLNKAGIYAEKAEISMVRINYHLASIYFKQAHTSFEQAKYADAATAYEKIINLDPLSEEERGKAKRGLVICYDWLRTQTLDKALKQEYERKFNQLWEELMD